MCSILWSTELKEMISGHGYSQNQLTIWKYPQMNRIAELTGLLYQVWVLIFIIISNRFSVFFFCLTNTGPHLFKVWSLTTAMIWFVGHEARVLSLTMSPCGTTVASAAADETIRLWKCFAKDKEKVKKTAQTKSVKETFSLPSRIR